MNNTLKHAPSWIVAAFVGIFVLAVTAPLGAQVKPEQAASMLLGSTPGGLQRKELSLCRRPLPRVSRKYGNHKEANAARYGLALCLLDGPTKDYNGAIRATPAPGRRQRPARTSVRLVLPWTGRRGLGAQALALALAKPQEANQQRNTAQQRFDEASKNFAAAGTAFTARIPKSDTPPKETPIELEWAAQRRCDQAEMLLRLHKAKEAQTVAAAFLQEPDCERAVIGVSALYYHGFACFLSRIISPAGKSLGLLTPFTDPVFGTHARYLLARVHHPAGERRKALEHYEGVLADHTKRKQAATEELKQAEPLQERSAGKGPAGSWSRGPLPDHVARGAFFLGVMEYEDGKFAEAATQLTAFRQQFPNSPLAAEAQLRLGFCQVQLKQFAERSKTLQPLVDKEPRLADQALLWIAKAQAGRRPGESPRL